MDTIISLLVSAISLGAAAGLRSTTQEAITDSYEALKQILIKRYSSNNRLIEAAEEVGEDPENIQKQNILKKELNEAGAEKDPTLVSAANTVLITLSAKDTRKKIYRNRLQRKITQVEAIENQIDLTIDGGHKSILEEKAESLWEEISSLEKSIE
jgi:hypothetical protein